jgi:hypothetical protein
VLLWMVYVLCWIVSTSPDAEYYTLPEDPDEHILALILSPSRWVPPDDHSVGS